MGSWSPFGAYAGTLLGSAAGAIVSATLSPDAVTAYGWRIPFLIGLAVGLGGLVIRRHFVERVPHQPPAKSPLGEAFGAHWRTILHLVALSAGLAVGFYTVFVYATTWLAQVASVPARTAFAVNTFAMALSLGMVLSAGRLSDHFSRRSVLLAVSGLLAVLAVPAMTLMARGQIAGLLVGQALLGMLVSATSGVLPAAMAELAPWRVRCTVLSIAYNLGMALLGGTTPLVAAWLVSRSGYALAPAWYMTAAAALAFVAALLLPRTLPHRLTAEFQAARSRAAHTPAS
jgi:MHS family proline/betaine transporter-like MFS transporter